MTQKCPLTFVYPPKLIIPELCQFKYRFAFAALSATRSPALALLIRAMLSVFFPPSAPPRYNHVECAEFCNFIFGASDLAQAKEATVSESFLMYLVSSSERMASAVTEISIDLDPSKSTPLMVTGVVNRVAELAVSALPLSVP